MKIHPSCILYSGARGPGAVLITGKNEIGQRYLPPHKCRQQQGEGSRNSSGSPSRAGGMFGNGIPVDQVTLYIELNYAYSRLYPLP